MDPAAAEYSSLQPKQFPARELRETAEGKYWRGFSVPSTAKQVRMHIELQAFSAVSPSPASARLADWLCYVP